MCTFKHYKYKFTGDKRKKKQEDGDSEHDCEDESMAPLQTIDILTTHYYNIQTINY